MKQIDILGSCVTRDAFEFPMASDYTPAPYFARSSLISIYSPSLEIKKEGIILKSQFQQKTVFNDLNKVFRQHINNSTSHFLIIDFIDERFDILKYKDSYLTNSDEYKNSNLPTILNTTTLEKNQEYFKLWELAALRFVQDLKIRQPKSVILHKAFWCKKYIDKDGNIQSFPNQERIDLNNKRLERMYAFVERNLPGILKSIHLRGEYLSDINHRWGLSPFHYESKYYEDFIKELKAIELTKI
jgi:hypothetical protein